MLVLARLFTLLARDEKTSPTLVAVTTLWLLFAEVTAPAFENMAS